MHVTGFQQPAAPSVAVLGQETAHEVPFGSSVGVICAHTAAGGMAEERSKCKKSGGGGSMLGCV